MDGAAWDGAGLPAGSPGRAWVKGACGGAAGVSPPVPEWGWAPWSHMKGGEDRERARVARQSVVWDSLLAWGWRWWPSDTVASREGGLSQQIQTQDAQANLDFR